MIAIHRPLTGAIGLVLFASSSVGWLGPQASAQRPAPVLIENNPNPVWGPDVFGGYVSSHIVVRVKPGVLPAQRADGTWTFKSELANLQPAAGKAGRLSADAVAAAMKQRGVTSVRSPWKFPPANKALAAQHGLDRYYLIDVPQGSDTPTIAAQFAKLTEVFESAQVDGIGGIASVPNDPSFSLQWNMNNTGQNGGTPDADVDAPECWDLTQGAATVMVAIIDTGVQPDHPDLNGKVVSGWNTRDENADTTDPHGHGTHCAGNAAARGNDGIGVAGMNWNAMILAMRCTSSGGAANETDCAEAVEYAADNGADVLSMSLQFSTGSDILKNAVAYAYDSGVLPVAAAGNSPTLIYPGAFPKCMAIGSTNKFDGHVPGSNSGPQVDVSAPGDQIFSDWKDSGYSTQSGTSMATPHVSGLATLILNVNPALTPAQVENIIKVTADDKGPAGFDNDFGWGRLNARKAIEAAIPICPGNVNGDVIVNIDDLLAVINAWGPCVVCATDIAPTGGDGQVNIDDLLKVINGWGGCP